MHDGTGFSAATRERVLEAAADLGWLPSGRARGLAMRRAGIIGLLFPDFTSTGDAEEESPLYVDQVIRGAERAATAHGDAVLIAATRGSSGRELALSVAGKVDGLVVVARSLTAADLESVARSLPVVVLANRTGRGPRFDSVGADNRGGVRSLVAHLLEQHDYRDLVFIGGLARSPDSMERFAGFREALRSAGLPAPVKPDAEGAFTEAGGARAVRELLADRRPPNAIVCGNDEMALGQLASPRHEIGGLDRAAVHDHRPDRRDGIQQLLVGDRLTPVVSHNPGLRLAGAVAHFGAVRPVPRLEIRG